MDEGGGTTDGKGTEVSGYQGVGYQESGYQGTADDRGRRTEDGGQKTGGGRWVLILRWSRGWFCGNILSILPYEPGWVTSRYERTISKSV